jgi:hypothetical protein
MQDQGYQSEQAVAWERLDNERGDTTYCTADFEEYIAHEARHAREQARLLGEVHMSDSERVRAAASNDDCFGSSSLSQVQEHCQICVRVTIVYSAAVSHGRVTCVRCMQLRADEATARRLAAEDAQAAEAAGLGESDHDMAVRLQRQAQVVANAQQRGAATQGPAATGDAATGGVIDSDAELAALLQREVDAAVSYSGGGGAAESDAELAARLQREERAAFDEQQRRRAQPGPQRPPSQQNPAWQAQQQQRQQQPGAMHADPRLQGARGRHTYQPRPRQQQQQQQDQSSGTWKGWFKKMLG